MSSLSLKLPIFRFSFWPRSELKMSRFAGLRSGKDIVARGGAEFARSLVMLDLIDEYRLFIHPVALGVGLPLFAELPKPVDLKLVSSSTFASGVAAHVYQRA